MRLMLSASTNKLLIDTVPGVTGVNVHFVAVGPLDASSSLPQPVQQLHTSHGLGKLITGVLYPLLSDVEETASKHSCGLLHEEGILHFAASCAKVFWSMKFQLLCLQLSPPNDEASHYDEIVSIQ
jgi:hypothetical protein